ncbi:MAG: archease [Chloroflexota bacterium]
MAEPRPPDFEELAHTADLRLRAHGASLADLFAHAAQGLFALMQGQPAADAQPVAQAVRIASYDTTALLVDWLSELLYLSERDSACYHTFDIQDLTDTGLAAQISGYRPGRVACAVKAVTFFDLDIIRLDSGLYCATITLDV